MPRGPNGPNAKRKLEDALALARTGDFSGLDVLVAALASDDAEVRIKAAYYCERIGFPAAIGPLSRMAAEDSESHNRNQAIYALVGVGRPAVVPALVAALNDPDGERREDARTALYRLLGRDVLPLLSDEEWGDGRDPDEAERVAEWWRKAEANFDPGLVYYMGEPASPGLFIEQLKQTQTSLPDALLNPLSDWTGEDFGQQPLPKVISRWEKWWGANREKYVPGRRYFYGHPVP